MSRNPSRLIHGVGINDANYATHVTVSGGVARCPYYKKWSNMLMRCYSAKYQEKHPTYIGCTVCDEWHSFMKFKEWMALQDWEEMQLDKDILGDGTGIYSPETCAFIDRATNQLLTNRAAERGEYPQGVSLHKPTGMFRAYCRQNGKLIHLGYFHTKEKAEAKYKWFKAQIIISCAIKQTDSRVGYALRVIAAKY